MNTCGDKKWNVLTNHYYFIDRLQKKKLFSIQIATIWSSYLYLQIIIVVELVNIFHQIAKSRYVGRGIKKK